MEWAGSSSSGALLLLAIASGLAACGPEAPPAQMTSRLRLAAGGPTEARVAFDDDSRLVIRASTATLLGFDLKATVPANREETLSIAWPDEFRAAPWIAIEPLVQASDDTMVPGPSTLLGTDRHVLPETYALRFPSGLEPGAETRFTVNGRPIPRLSELDVESKPFVVPEGAELRASVAIEEPAWRFESVPVRMSVEAVAGDEVIPLYAVVLDPRRVESDRGWHDVRVALGTLTGREVRLRLTARTSEPGDGPSLPVWSDPRIVAPSRDTHRPGIVLISLDTVRVASTSLGGAARDTTPALVGRVANEGVLFGTAIAPFPHTLPSHMSLFTGLYFERHGVRGAFTRLGDERPTLSSILHDAGWVGGAFTENGYLIGSLGFQRGFTQWVENKSPNLHRPTGQGPEVFRAGLDWLARHADEPFFLLLHTYQAHWPYTPADGYDDLFASSPLPPPGPERERLKYEQEIRHTDDLVAEVLEALRRLGVERQTLVVVTSDHGEEFGEHGQRFHGFQLYDESLQVPLVMRWPDGLPAGRRVDFPVSLVDVAPTILELLDLPVPAGLDGRSLVPWIRDASRPPPESAVFAQAPKTLTSGTVDLLGVRTATRKCIRNQTDDTIECYDLVADPAERSPLPSPSDEETRAAISRLDAFAKVGGAPTDRAPADDRVLDPALEKKLRALGYL